MDIKILGRDAELMIGIGGPSQSVSKTYVLLKWGWITVQTSASRCRRATERSLATDAQTDPRLFSRGYVHEYSTGIYILISEGVSDSPDGY